MRNTPLDGAKKHSSSKACPVGHPWRGTLTTRSGIRMGEQVISVVVRQCTACTAEELRYVTPPPSERPPTAP
ncbi:MAG: hypothetical protein JNG84_06165 [Archangium sp.]|nr:hypothetical protein [Archangium sp.]